jgi:hypothetical protein
VRLRERRDYATEALRYAFLAFVLGILSLLGTRPTLAAEAATVTYTQDFSGSDPEHYSISVQSDGSAAYECVGKISKDSDDSEPYQSAFKFSDATRARIFDLAAKAQYFSGKIDSGNQKLAFSGAKKLSYKDGSRNFTAEYNYSLLLPVQQLTSLFQGVSATLEFGRRLAYYHRYQKLALDEELKTMEAQARNGSLAELQAVKPILQEIYDDTSVINVVRARAEKLIEMGDSGKATR